MSPPSASSLPAARLRVRLGWTTVALAAAGICWALAERDVHQAQQAALEREFTRSNFVGSFWDADFRSAAADLRVLAESDNLQDLLSGRDNGQFVRDILHRLEADPEYDQIRFIDAAGRERARVERERGIMPASEFVDKKDTPYFIAAMSRPKGEIFLSPLHLRMKNGAVEQPFVSYFRLATPVFDSEGNRRGVVAINYLGSALFSRFNAMQPATRRNLRFLNAQGYWLKGPPGADIEYGSDLPGHKSDTLAITDPALWAQVSTQSEGQLRYNGGWFTWRRIEPYLALHQKPEPGSFVIAASELPAGDWSALAVTREQPYLVVAFILLAVVATGGIVHDARVRERGKTEDALRLAHDNAQASARLKAQFLANMSHEIRTPLNGVVGMTGLLLDTPLTPEQRSYANTVRTSADALLALINDILDFSKIEAGQLEFEQIPFDLRDPVENCLSLAAEKAHTKNLELAYLVDENVPVTLIGDPNRLHQVLLNLIGNAVKFTSRGEVVLTIAKTGEENGKARLRFSVKDTGVGVPPEIAARLFQPFVQGDSSTSRKFGGTGLGLAICRQLVTLMHGEIGVQNRPEGGAEFWFTAEFPIGTAAPRFIPRKTDIAGLRALIVDDNATNREILSRQLASWRLETSTAAEVHDALAQLKAAAAAGLPFQFVIFDMEMPGPSGLEGAQAARTDPTLGGLRQIILTSVGHQIPRAQLEAAGVSACLIKPARQSQLHDALVEAYAGSPTLAAGTDARTAPPAGAPPVSLRLLLVEDNKVNQHVARLQLEKFGYRPDIVGGGREAVDAVRAKRYDVVLMDCQMPDMDGFEATRRIRLWEAERRVSGEEFEPLPIIAMTANAMSGDREACLAAGMQDYVTKPVRVEELSAALARSQLRTAAGPGA